MTHYMIRTTLSAIQALCVELYNSETFSWEPIPLQQVGPDWYVGQLAEGQINIAKHGSVGGVSTWWEVTSDKPEAIERLGSINGPLVTMRDKMRSSQQFRQSHRAKGSTLIRNSNGLPVGVMPKFSICGRPPLQSYLDGADIDEIDELTDLE